MQALLRAVEKDKLALALKGASEKLRDMFFKNMTERAAKILKDDMEALGPVRLRDVDEAQAAIVSVAKDLAAQGEIEIAEDGEDEEMVYMMARASHRSARAAVLDGDFGVPERPAGARGDRPAHRRRRRLDARPCATAEDCGHRGGKAALQAAAARPV